jgi:predicted amidohydrolase YtcJ
MDHENDADVVLLGGRIITVDSDDTIAEAVALKDGRIIQVGNSHDVKHRIGDKTSVIQLQGKTVLPGFIDAHTHIEGIADYHLHLDVHIPPLKDVDEILEEVKKKAQDTPKGDWIVGQGGFGQPMPSKEALDIVSPEHPVVLRRSAHNYIVNSKVLEMANITKDTPDPPGGKIEKTSETREPTGLLTECYGLLPIPRNYETRKTAIKTVLQEFIQNGVTSIYDLPATTDGIRIYQELLDSNELPLRLRLQYTITQAPDGSTFPDCIPKLGLQTNFGNDWLTIGGVKLFVYGVPDNPTLNITQEELNRKVIEAHNAGLQIWIHAIGDKFTAMALEAYEQALKETPRKDHRHRIEHIGNRASTSTLEHLNKMKKLGIIPVPTSAWIYLGLQMERKEKRFLYRTLLDRGFVPPGNSDSLGAMPESINPLFSIWCAVARKTRRGQLNYPEESINVKEAIHLYTINAAYSGFEETVKGSIEKGKYADLIILSDDPLTVPISEIKNIKVETTIINGKIVYQKQ